MRLLTGVVSTALVLGALVVAMSGFGRETPQVKAAEPPHVSADPFTKDTKLSTKEAPEVLNPRVDSSIALPPSGALSGIQPVSASVDAADVRKTFKGKETADVMNAALALVNAGPEVNVGSDYTKSELAEYNSAVDTYNTRIYNAGTTSISQVDIQNYLAEFMAWCETFKRTKAASIHFFDNTVSMQPPKLKEQYLTYEPYTAITAVGTPHYKLRNLASSTEDGYRIYSGYKLVALGSYYGTEIGTTYNIYFDDGKVLKAILGDSKSDLHTDPTNKYRDSYNRYDGSSGNIVEIIFDTSVYSGPDTKEKINKINKKINEDYPGNVIKIEKTGVAKVFK